MPIIPNDVPRWPGAASRLVRPIDAGDCEISPDFKQICLQEAGAGRGCTIRAGQGFAARTVAQIEGSCTPLTPNPTSTDPSPIFEAQPWSALGAAFYDVPGAVHIGDAATWAGCGITMAQNVSAWTPTQIDLVTTNWAPAPSNGWLYVLNKYGHRNANGLAIAIVPSP